MKFTYTFLYTDFASRNYIEPKESNFNNLCSNYIYQKMLGTINIETHDKEDKIYFI